MEIKGQHKIIEGFVRQDVTGQFITNGKDCFENGKQITRLSNGDYVIMIVLKDFYGKEFILPKEPKAERVSDCCNSPFAEDCDHYGEVRKICSKCKKMCRPKEPSAEKCKCRCPACGDLHLKELEKPQAKIEPLDLYSEIHFSDLEPVWIVSNELIKRLKLEPTTYSGLSVQGEDGKTYDWATILKKHMDWVEERTNDRIS